MRNVGISRKTCFIAQIRRVQYIPDGRQVKNVNEKQAKNWLKIGVIAWIMLVQAITNCIGVIEMTTEQKTKSPSVKEQLTRAAADIVRNSFNAKGEVSSTGKTLLIAKGGGPTGIMVNGHEVRLTVSAYVNNPNKIRDMAAIQAAQHGEVEEE